MNPYWESGDAATEEDTSPTDMPVKTDSLVESRVESSGEVDESTSGRQRRAPKRFTYETFGNLRRTSVRVTVE